MRCEDCDNRGYDLVLYRKDLFELAIIALRPTMSSGYGIDQLRGDAQARTGPSYAASEQIAYPQVASNIAHVGRLALVLEAGITGDDEQFAEPRQRHRDILHDAICEILLLRVGTEVLERQHGNRGLVRECQCRSLPGCRNKIHHPKDPDRSVDVLEVLLPDILKHDVEFVAELSVGIIRNTNPARLRDGFEARRDVDAVAEYVPVVLDNIPDINADPELNPIIWRHI